MTLASRRPPPFFLLLLSLELVAAVLLAAGPSTAGASRAFLAEECSHVDRPGACMRLLGGMRWAIGCNDKRCLAGGIIGNLCLPKAKEASAFAAARAAQGRSPPASPEAWETCVNAYDALASDLDSAIDQLNDGDVNGASDTLSSADHYTRDCENAFRSKQPSPAKGWNDMLFDCVDVAGDLVLDMI